MRNKIYTLFTAFIALSLTAGAQEIAITGNQYHLYGPNATWGQYLQVGGNGQATGYAFVATTNGNLHLDSKAGFETYINHYNQGNTLINTQGGSVGIGNTAPQEKLDISGSIRFDRLRSSTAVFNYNSRNALNSFNDGKDVALSPGWIALDLGGNDNASDRLVIGAGFGGKAVIGTHNHNLTSWGGDFLINPAGGGNVAIGTTTARERLSVNGRIRAVEVKVEATNWPDYVFEEDYNVGTLKGLESYIKTNKHLPEMPTAKEVEANGIALGEMNKLLLKKVEELTLHLIKENNKALDRDKEIDELKTLLKEQQNRLGEIELKLKRDEK